jgi:multidrug efflux pump
MNFTDIFIKRPVLSSVVSLLIFIVGLASIFKMQLQQYPKVDRTQIIITTTYAGASSDIMQSFITMPIAKSIASANGIDYISSSSSVGVSQITAMLRLDANPDTALTEITGKVSAARSQLPPSADEPTIDRNSGQTLPDVILSFTSTELSPEQITAFITNISTPMIYSVDNVGQLSIWGAKNYAMRIWLNPEKMGQLGITTAHVMDALRSNNVLATPGQLQNRFQFIDLGLSTDLHSEKEFNELVIQNKNGHIIRLMDIGNADLAWSMDKTLYF